MHNRILIGLTLLLSAAIPSCGLTGGGPIRAESVTTSSVLQLEPTVRAYRAIDKNTADVYLTDLDRSALDLGAPLDEVSGQILHLHLFISPEAGATPIESTACSVTIRLMVISRGHIGVYGGGGFIMPDSDPGDSEFAGDIERATLRFMQSTPGFTDRLGPAELSGEITAPRNDPTTDRLAARFEQLLNSTTRRSDSSLKNIPE